MAKLITVIGATGLQGGSVARIFLTDPKLKGDWKVRGITRDVTKDSAKSLEALGAEMVQADIDDLESLIKAFEGSDLVFAVTNYWESMSKATEVRQGKEIVIAAKKNNVKQYIWSSAINVNDLSKGKLPHVYHFDGKAEVEDYVQELGLEASFFMPGFYMSNLKGLAGESPIHLGEDGNWTLSLPAVPADGPIPVFDTRDTGKYVKGMVLNWEKVKGKRMLGASEYMTPDDMVAIFKEVFPKVGATAKYVAIPEADYRARLEAHSLPEYVQTELVENFRLFAEFGYYGGEKLDWSHSLMEDEPTSFRDFLKEGWSQLA